MGTDGGTNRTRSEKYSVKNLVGSVNIELRFLNSIFFVFPVNQKEADNVPNRTEVAWKINISGEL